LAQGERDSFAAVRITKTLKKWSRESSVMPDNPIADRNASLGAALVKPHFLEAD
jgi:hypothetical protein